MTVSENIKRLCKEKGTSMYKVERELGIGNGTIGKWGKNGRVPNYDTLLSVASHLGVTVSELMGDTMSFSTAGKNIVVAAGNLNAAKRILHNLNIREDDINSMLYSEYNWTDETLTQIAKALGCSVDTLKKEKAPDHMVEDLSADELEIVSILRKMSPEQLARELAHLRQIPGDAQDK